MTKFKVRMLILEVVIVYQTYDRCFSSNLNLNVEVPYLGWVVAHKHVFKRLDNYKNVVGKTITRASLSQVSYHGLIL